MSQFDKELKVYAENGLRTAADWQSTGRVVETGSAPRASVTCKGQHVELFTRDQTAQYQRPDRK